MPDFLAIGTDRGYSMAGTGIGIGISEFRVKSLAFSPAKVSGLQIWLDASDSSTVFQSNGGSAASADGDPLGYWMDKSGNGWHYTQASGTNKPAIRTNVQNAKPVIRFDGVNDYIDAAGPTSTTADVHIFIIAKASSTTNFARPFFWTGTANNNGMYGTPMYTGGINFDLRAANGQELSGGVFRATTDISSAFFGFECTFNGTSKTGEIFKSGVSLGTSTNASISTVAASGKYSRVGAAGSFGTPATYWSGDVAEVVVYDSIKTGADLTALRAYFTAKWSTY